MSTESALNPKPYAELDRHRGALSGARESRQMLMTERQSSEGSP